MVKAAVFIHGWAVDQRVFHRRWMKDRGAPLYELLSEKHGYEIHPLK